MLSSSSWANSTSFVGVEYAHEKVAGPVAPVVAFEEVFYCHHVTGALLRLEVLFMKKA